MTSSEYKSSLKRVAMAFRNGLLECSKDTQFRVEKAQIPIPTDTDGWAIPLGRVGRSGPLLEIWLDRYTGHKTPTFWYGFYSREIDSLNPIIHSTPRELRATWRLRDSDTELIGGTSRVITPFRPDEFNKAVVENYPNWNSFYFGVYEKPVSFSETSMVRLGRRGAALVQDILVHMPGSKAGADCQDAYPQFENRKIVQSHLRRERSAALAEACKQRDDYQCTICDLSGKKYDGLASATLESHHITPLHKLRPNVLTRLKDLTTVCANCHRMLHRMSGAPGDVQELKRLVKQVGQ